LYVYFKSMCSCTFPMTLQYAIHFAPLQEPRTIWEGPEK
jgi:hypothetical protein